MDSPAACFAAEAWLGAAGSGGAPGEGMTPLRLAAACAHVTADFHPGHDFQHASGDQHYSDEGSDLTLQPAWQGGPLWHDAAAACGVASCSSGASSPVAVGGQAQGPAPWLVPAGSSQHIGSLAHAGPWAPAAAAQLAPGSGVTKRRAAAGASGGGGSGTKKAAARIKHLQTTLEEVLVEKLALQEQLKVLLAAQTELLTNVSDVTAKWRAAVAENAELQAQCGRLLRQVQCGDQPQQP